MQEYFILIWKSLLSAGFVGFMFRRYVCCHITFCNDKELTYIKADIEGEEVRMLNGGGISFREKVRKALITTYHRPYDEDKIRDFMDMYGYESEYNPGYCLYVNDRSTFKPPYVRHGVLFGKRKSADV